MTDVACGHERDWAGLYKRDYDLATSESNQHPAKASWDLAFRILEHLQELGLADPETDTILDPMAGTARFLIAAAAKGYRAIGVELEPRFMDMCVSYWCLGIPKVTVTPKVLPAQEAAWVINYRDGEFPGTIQTEIFATRQEVDTFTQSRVVEKIYHRRAVPQRTRYKVHSQCRCGKADWHACHWVVGNIEYASKKLGRALAITIIQGDARKLSSLLQERGLIAVSSPPYAHPMQFDGERKRERSNAGEHLGQRDDVYFSEGNKAWQGLEAGYGTSPGQIGALPDRPMKAVLSPPFLDAQTGGGISARMRGEGSYKLTTSLPGSVYQPSEHGTSEGQIGAMADRPMVACTSPPYEDSEVCISDASSIEGRKRRRADSTWQGYGQAEGQIGQEREESYLSEMKKVYAEIARVADVLAVVVKCPTRQGKLRRLDLDTIALMEATGWRIVCHHHALLFSEQVQGHLFDGSVKRVKGRMSFFKRLQWQKGKSEIAQWEDVIIAVRDGDNGMCCLTSPPYHETGNKIPSGSITEWKNKTGEWRTGLRYSDNPANIGNLKDRP